MCIEKRETDVELKGGRTGRRLKGDCSIIGKEINQHARSSDVSQFNNNNSNMRSILLNSRYHSLKHEK